MSVTLRRRALLLVVLSLSICSSCAHETTTKSVSGTVVKIVDGDTITILDSQKVQYKIRLQGIDAPERKQAFSQVSRENLGSLVFGKQVKVEYQKLDQWGRLIGKVWIDGNDECLEQVKAGLAWHFKRYENEQSPADRQLYANAEQEARAQKRGLWQDSNPTPPWEFRHHTIGATADFDLPDEAQSSDLRTTSDLKTTNPPSADRNSKNPLSSDFKNAPKPSVHPTTTVNPTTTLIEEGQVRGNRRR